MIAQFLVMCVWELYIMKRQVYKFTETALPEQLKGLVSEEDFHKSQVHNKETL